MKYRLTFEDGSSVYLAHHGVKGMKWGKWNAETTARYKGTGKTPYTSGDTSQIGGGGGGAVDEEDDENLTSEEKEALAAQKQKELEENEKAKIAPLKGEKGQRYVDALMEGGDIYRAIKAAADKGLADGSGSSGFIRSLTEATAKAAKSKGVKKANQIVNDTSNTAIAAIELSRLADKASKSQKQEIQNTEKDVIRELKEQNQKEHGGDILWNLAHPKGYTNEQFSDKMKERRKSS